MNNESGIRFAFFGSSKFSEYVLDELRKAGFEPIVNVDNAKDPLPELKTSPNPLLTKERATAEQTGEVDIGIVASFGKILPKGYLEIPKHGFINVHPSLLPKYRGPSPIQAQLLDIACREVGVTIIKMDEKMDHGPILAQEDVEVRPWPDHYAYVEEKLARAGGKLLVRVLEDLTQTSSPPSPSPRRGLDKVVLQDDALATYCKLVKKEDGLLNLSEPAEVNLRKVLAYSTWPGAYLIFKRKQGDEVRVVVKNAKIIDGKFMPTRVIPAGKKEMDWESFLRGNA